MKNSLWIASPSWVKFRWPCLDIYSTQEGKAIPKEFFNNYWARFKLNVAGPTLIMMRDCQQSLMQPQAHVIIIFEWSLVYFVYFITQSNFFAARCKIMQHYVMQLYNIMQHYIIRGDISPHIRRLIVVNDLFCGDNCP